MNKVIIRHEPNDSLEDSYEIYYVEWDYAKDGLVERYLTGRSTYEDAVDYAQKYFNRKKPDMVLDL